MKNASTNWDKIFIGFGILTIVSGIYLITQKDYLIGISGSFVGIGLVAMNIAKLKNQK